MKKILFLFLLLPISSTLAYQATPTTSTMEITKEETAKAPRGLLPYIALGGGYTGYDTIGSVEGSPATLKLLGSYYFENPYVIDLGYGVNNQQFNQAAKSQDTAVTGGAFEIAARYRWESRWQAGVIANHFFEQGRALSAEQGDAQFAGLQVLREFNITDSWLARIGARAMGLTNNTGSLVTMYLVDLQIGWNPSAYKPSVKQTTEASPIKRESVVSEATREPETIAETSRPVATVQPSSPLKDLAYTSLMDKDQSIQFGSSRAAISAQDQARLSKVAKALSNNKDLYDRIEVYGYTDTSGSAAINQKISQQRADSVRSSLVKGGLSDVSIAATGKGSAESTGNIKSDRRAELIFIGVKDEAKLKEILSNLE